MVKKLEELETWRLTDQQKLTFVGVLAHHLVRLDPQRKGVRLVDFVASLYPPKPEDGLDKVRQAADKLTRTIKGGHPEPVRLGRIFGVHKHKLLPGGLRIENSAFHMDHNCILWTAVGQAQDAAPALTGDETVAAAPTRPQLAARTVVDDTLACRQQIERFIGSWLAQHRADLGACETVSVAASDGAEIALRSGRFVLVMYAMDMTTEPRLRMPAGHWKALGLAREHGAEIYICMCNDEPGFLSLHPYQDYLDQNRTIENDVVYWSIDTHDHWWSENFKEIVPHILSIRMATSKGSTTATLPTVSRFLKMMLREEPELAAAVKRGWLLNTMRPEAGIVDYWAQRCEIEDAVDLYVCVYPSRGSGDIPGVPGCSVRLDLGPSGLSFSEVQMQAVLDAVAALLSETSSAVAKAMRATDRATVSGLAKHLPLVTTPRILSFVCFAQVPLAEQIGAVIYQHVNRLRPKRLGALGR